VSEHNLHRKVDPFTRLYLLIREPRVIRILQALVYVSMLVGGISVVVNPSPTLIDVLTWRLQAFGLLLVGGGLLGALAVLPGWWWLERLGLIFLGTAIAVYTVVVITGTSAFGPAISIALLFTLGKRWAEVRKYQVAPKG